MNKRFINLPFCAVSPKGMCGMLFADSNRYKTKDRKEKQGSILPMWSTATATTVAVAVLLCLLCSCATVEVQPAPEVSSSTALPAEAEASKPYMPPTQPSSELPMPDDQGNSYIRSLADAAIDSLPLTGMDDFGRIQAAYKYLIETTYFATPLGLDSWQLHEGKQPDYIENRALSPLAYGIGSCEDYACAMVVLLQQMGFEAQYIPGITISVQGDYVDHAWAAVQVKGAWYHLDPQLEDNIIKDQLLRYRYFLKTDSEMLVDHRWGSNLIEYASLTDEQRKEVEQSYILPVCTKSYPAPRPIKLANRPRPNIGEITARIASERTAYETKNGALPGVTLNIVPPVFGTAGYGPPD